MRVTIQTTHELKDVPKKVSEVVNEAIVELKEKVLPVLEESSGLLKYSRDPAGITTVFDNIMKAKTDLGSASETLEDCIQILLGYGKVVNQLAEEAKQKANEISPTVDEIVSQIEEVEAIVEEEPEGVTDEGN
tara:strand:+ start:2700 stop:3098 length:399 start_codon:yes stop_codon:yes gene_type:complete